MVTPHVEHRFFNRPQGKVMFSHMSVILFTIGLMDTQSLLILVNYSDTPCYGVVGTHPTGILSCFFFVFFCNCLSLMMIG